MDRWDIVAGYWWYANNAKDAAHAQSIFARLEAIKYGPGLSERRGKLSPGARAVFRRLRQKFGCV